ncbi:MAG: PorV/PorQ family protein [Candidatus Krumholzibacteriota bacterium]
MVVRKCSFLLVLGLLISCVTGANSPSHAADLLRLHGEENAGTAGAQFLRIPVGARSVALGKAFTAMATDASTLYWNPAGVMRTPGRTNFYASHSKYTAGIDLDYLSFHRRDQNYGYGLSMGVLRSGDILRTDEFHQQGTGTYFNANQFFLGATLARAMTDRFSIGGTVKYYQENLDEFQIKSLLADLGILYFVGLGDLKVGFAVKNFGGDLKPAGNPPALADGYVSAAEFQKFPAPTEGTFGAAKTWELSQNIGLVTTTDFNHPSDNKESFRFGMELGMRKMLYLRGGFETGRVDGGLAAGFGLQLKRKQFLLRVDYAYSDMGAFGTIHHISVDLSPLTRGKDPEAWRRESR